MLCFMFRGQIRDGRCMRPLSDRVFRSRQWFSCLATTQLSAQLATQGFLTIENAAVCVKNRCSNFFLNTLASTRVPFYQKIWARKNVRRPKCTFNMRFTMTLKNDKLYMIQVDDAFANLFEILFNLNYALHTAFFPTNYLYIVLP